MDDPLKEGIEKGHDDSRDNPVDDEVDSVLNVHRD